MKSEKTITVTLEMEEVMNEACELVDLLKKANSLSNELAEKLKSSTDKHCVLYVQKKIFCSEDIQYQKIFSLKKL